MVFYSVEWLKRCLVTLIALVTFYAQFTFQVFIWGFRDNDLQGISFLDMHYYVHSLVSMRNIAIACDMHDSMSLIRFQVCWHDLLIVSNNISSTTAGAVQSSVDCLSRRPT